jgi:hypothetical protein
MNAFLLAITFTLAVVLDYLWDRFEGQLGDKRRAHWLKMAVVFGLLGFAWVQAILQFKRDRESDEDMKYLKTQLAAANISLTNTTTLVKGLATGGNSFPTPTLLNTDQTNSIGIGVQLNGELPLRNVTVRVTDETERINSQMSGSTNVPVGKVTFEGGVGDIVPGPFIPPTACAQSLFVRASRIGFD